VGLGCPAAIPSADHRHGLLYRPDGAGRFLSGLRDRGPPGRGPQDGGQAVAGVDPQLVEAARHGDQAALDALLRAARPQIRRYAERHCIANAEDATQEALWIVHRKLPALRSVAAFPIWLLRIVVRICTGFIGPLWRRIEELKEDEPAAAPAVDMELRLDLARAVEALPETYREPILMHYFQDMPLAEIAARLGIGESAAKVRLHRGRERIRILLAGGDRP
jgi:RNA polymerase sigma factor (sigma-70 family)